MLSKKKVDGVQLTKQFHLQMFLLIIEDENILPLKVGRVWTIK